MLQLIYVQLRIKHRPVFLGISFYAFENLCLTVIYNTNINIIMLNTSRTEKRYDTGYLLNIFKSFNCFKAATKISLKNAKVCPHEKLKFYHSANFFIFG